MGGPLRRGTKRRSRPRREPGSDHENSIYELTGPEAFSLSEAVRRLSMLTGKANRYEPMTYEAGQTRLLAAGAQPWQAELWLGSYPPMGAGELADVTGDVANPTGRARLSMPQNLSKGAAA